MRRIVVPIFILAFLLSTCAASVNAKPLKGFYSNCLDAKMYSAGPPKTAPVAGTRPPKEDEGGAPHAAELLIIPAKKPKWPSSTVYVFMCSGRQGVCGAVSTDGSDINLKLFGTSGQRATEDQQGIQGRGSIISGTNPNQTDAEALHFVNAPLVWSAYSKAAIPHAWSWVQPIEQGDVTTPPVTLAPDEAVMLNDNEFEVGQDQGLKIGQIAMENTQQTQTTTSTTGTGGTGTKCANIQWDPRGYVLDAETLNPVKDITITLYEKNKDGSYTQVPSGIGTTNPYTTATNSGQFNFFVQPGLFKITVDPKNAVIAEKSSLNPAYQRLFSDESGDAHLYEKDADIEEIAGRVAVAHIPVRISDKSLIIDSLNLIMEDAVVGMDDAEQKSQMHITGTVSHPKSKLTITLTALNEVGKMITLPVIYKTTNDFGEYDFYIDQEQTQADGRPLYLQNINVKIELNSFYTDKSLSKNNKPVSYDIKPLPRYIEGFAYDEKGFPIPNAIVGIYPYFSLNPMYMTIADKNGRFKFGSDHVPQMNYVLKYKKQTGDTVQVNPEIFIRQNIGYYSQEAIDPFAEQNVSASEEKAMWALVDKTVSDNDVDILTHKTANRQFIPPLNNGNMPEKQVLQKTPINFSAIFTGIVIVGLLGVAVFIGIQLKRKNSSLPQ